MTPIEAVQMKDYLAKSGGRTDMYTCNDDYWQQDFWIPRASFDSLFDKLRKQLQRNECFSGGGVTPNIWHSTYVRSK